MILRSPLQFYRVSQPELTVVDARVDVRVVRSENLPRKVFPRPSSRWLWERAEIRQADRAARTVDRNPRIARIMRVQVRHSGREYTPFCWNLRHGRVST